MMKDAGSETRNADGGTPERRRSPRDVRIGSALFNADHTRLGDEVRRVEAAGVDFLHLDVFDGYFVPDQGFSARTIRALRPLTRLPFEVHLAANEPLHFLPALAEAGVDLVFLPAEATPLLYEAVYTVRELGMKAGLCLALGTSLALLDATLPMLDAVLLLGRVTGEGTRGRAFNELVVERVRAARRMIEQGGHDIDLQAAGGLEMPDCLAVCAAGATALPLGGSLHRERDQAAYVARLRLALAGTTPAPAPRPAPVASAPVPPFNVLIGSRSFGKNCPEVLDAMRAAGCVFTEAQFDGVPTEDEMVRQIGSADALVSGTEPVTARVLAAAPRLRVIAKHGVGYDNIDLDAARARGVPVALAGGAIATSVADLAMGLLLAVARHIPQGDASTRRGEWKRFVGTELDGKTLGIVGLGQIGKAVCRRAMGFGMRVVAHDAYEDAAFAATHDVAYCTLDDLLAQSDFVTLHAPVTPATRHLIGASQLRRMKRSAYLINTARGELVDETALLAALRDGTIAGAASDVFAHEPPGDHPLLALDTFVAMPHSGGQTVEGLRRMGEITGENVLRVMRGEEPLYRVA